MENNYGSVFGKTEDVDFKDLLLSKNSAEEPLYITLSSDDKRRKIAYSSIEKIAEDAFRQGVKSLHICIVNDVDKVPGE